MARTKEKLEALKRGVETTVDPVVLAFVSHPGPDERAVLILASVLNDTGPKNAAVSWDHQCEAAAYFNEHGLARTLDRIVDLGGPEYLQPGCCTCKGVCTGSCSSTTEAS